MQERYKSKIVVDLLLKRKNKNNKDEILLLLRQNTGYLDGYYDLPGGHVDKNEDIFSAMIRETNEEVGIDIYREEMEIAHIYHHYKKDMLKFVFITNKYTGILVNNEPKNCKELKWFEIDRLPTNIIPKIKKEILNIKNGTYYDYDSEKV